MYKTRVIKRIATDAETWFILLTQTGPDGETVYEKAFGVYATEGLAQAVNGAIVETLKLCGKIVK